MQFAVKQKFVDWGADPWCHRFGWYKKAVIKRFAILDSRTNTGTDYVCHVIQATVRSVLNATGAHRTAVTHSCIARTSHWVTTSQVHEASVMYQ